MMKCFVVIFVFGFVSSLLALPVSKQEKPDKKVEEEETAKNHTITYDEGYDKDDPRNSPEMELEYSHYLQEVVSALESDPEFRAKLNNAPEVDVRSGKIAHELDFVAHNVRTRLDELKRGELERLRRLAIQQYELSNGIDRNHLKIAEHLDHQNEHTFEVDDLKKLIQKTTSDLAEADRMRREEFKRYEMQKEFEKQEKLRGMDEDHQKKLEEEMKQQQEKHNKHDPIHQPGHKAQLEEVWEKQDQMDGEFDPKTFFLMHDLDGNGVWDELEVKALFARELDKVYQQGMPEDDLKERAEEMERMREHVFKEADTNKDNLISYDEFIEQTKRAEFKKDDKWETVDNVPQYTHEEYLDYERKRQEEIKKLIDQGMLPPHPNMPQGYYPGPQGPYQAHPNEIPHGNGYPENSYQQYQQQVHRGNGIPPQHQQQFQQPHPNQQQFQAQHPNQQQFQHHPNQQQFQQHPNQQNPNQQHFQQQQHPNQQHPNQQQFQQPPQQQFQQPPPQQQQLNQQVPVQQPNPNIQYQPNQPQAVQPPAHPQAQAVNNQPPPQQQQNPPQAQANQNQAPVVQQQIQPQQPANVQQQQAPHH